MTSSFEFVENPDGEVLRIAARGTDVLGNALINRGTAFTTAEREALDLTGLLPSQVVDIEDQLRRVYSQYRAQPDALSKYLFLTAMHDRNEVLYFRLLGEHIEEMLPIVYTPTIGQAIEQYSYWYHRPRGIFLSIDDPDGIEESLAAMGHDSDEVDLIVVTDSEGILGIGDQGVGGVAITIGKLAVYTAAAGIHPHRVLPVVLDVGTDNMELLNDDGYLGVRHGRVRGEKYDQFIDKFLTTAHDRYPSAMIHWEDFGAANATRILDRYRDDYCTFNDDIQGTAAVVLAALVSAVKVSGIKLSDHRIVVHGAGTAGVGIAELGIKLMMEEGMSESEARSHFWALGSRGLLREGIPMRDFQESFARPASELSGWHTEDPGKYELIDVVRNVKPTILIGTSAQQGAFDENVVKEMARHCDRPIIMPLSNPISRAEAIPSDIIEWTGGSALIATGSPFDPVQYRGTTYHIAQANNALIFPGVGLGVIASNAKLVSDSMISAAAKALAKVGRPRKLGESLLPDIDQLRPISARVGMAVAQQASQEGLAQKDLDNPVDTIFQTMWRPEYPRIEVI